MRTRPWPLVILALIQILTPAMNILFNSVALKVSPAQVLFWVFQRPPHEIFESMALMPIAGFAIYQMKKWSYPVFLGSMAWSIYSNVRHWQYASSHYSISTVLMVYFFEIVLVLYFLVPAVRRTFFDPTIRWWESKPRYELKLNSELVVSGKSLPTHILNLSEGGAFVSGAHQIALGEPIELNFDVLSLPFSAVGKIVHVRDLGNGHTCFGIQFEHTRETEKRLRDLTKGLKSIGFQDRTQSKSWHESLTEWALTLLKTGKGWRPEYRVRGQK